MASGKTVFRDAKALTRDCINEITASLTDKDIFTSIETQEFINAQVRAMTGKKASELTARIVFDETPGAIVGCTDHRLIHINAGSDTIQSFIERPDRIMAVYGIAYHEIAHCLFCDRKEFVAAIKSLSEGVFYGEMPIPQTEDERLWLTEMTSLMTSEVIRPFFVDLFSEIHNFILDEHDERAIIDLYGDEVAACIYRVRETLHGPSFDDVMTAVAAGKHRELAAYLTFVFQMARFGEFEIIDENFAKSFPLYEYLVELKPLLSRAAEYETTEELFAIINEVMFRSWPYIRRELAMQLAAMDMFLDELKNNKDLGLAPKACSNLPSIQIPLSMIPPEVIEKMRNSVQNAGKGMSTAAPQLNDNQRGKPAPSKRSQSPSGSKQGQSGQSANSRQDSGESSGSSGIEGSDSSLGISASEGTSSDGRQGIPGSSNGHGSNEGPSPIGDSKSMSANGRDPSSGRPDIGSDISSASVQNSQSFGSSKNDGTDEKHGESGATGTMNGNSASKDEKNGSDSAQSVDSKPNGTDKDSEQMGKNGTGGNVDGRSDKEGNSGQNGQGDASNQSNQNQNKAIDGNVESARPEKSDSSAMGTSAVNRDALEGDPLRMVSEEAIQQARANAKEKIDLITKQIARNRAAEIVESTAAGELIELARGAGLNSAHRNYPCNVYRDVTVSQSAKHEYAQIAGSQRSYLKSLVKQMETAFKDMSIGSMKRHQAVGNRFHANDAHRLDALCFSNKRSHNDRPDIAVSILVDKSGSMAKSRIIAAQKTGVLLYDFCQALDIPCMVAGHHITRGMSYEIYSDFRQMPNDKYLVAKGLTPNSVCGCNRDGMALLLSASLLEKRTEPVKLLMVISDGQPNDNNYTGKSAETDIKEIVKRNERKGIKTIAFAIGDDKDRIKDIYGENFVDISDLNTMPKKLAKIIRRYVIESMS